MFFVFLFFLLFTFNLEADESGSSSYRERFRKIASPKREEPIEEGKGDGWGGGPKRGKAGKGKKKKDDVRRIVGGSHDPIVPVTGVKTGDLTAVTYKSPTPAAPLLQKAWSSTAWAPTYQPASRSLLGKKGNLDSVIQTDLIKNTGWQVDGDSISISPDLNGGPYDVETGQPITFTVDRETSVDFLGMPGRVASALTWDNPISLLGPYNPFKFARKNPLKNPFGIVQSGRRLLNKAGVLSAWAFEEGGVQITEDGGIGIVHDPSDGEAFLAGLGIALWFTPIKVGPVLSAGARIIPGAARTLSVAAALGRGAWGRVSGLSQRAWGQVASTANQLGRWTVGAARGLGLRVQRRLDDWMRQSWPYLDDRVTAMYSGIPSFSQFFRPFGYTLERHLHWRDEVFEKIFRFLSPSNPPHYAVLIRGERGELTVYALYSHMFKKIVVNRRGRVISENIGSIKGSVDYFIGGLSQLTRSQGASFHPNAQRDVFGIFRFPISSLTGQLSLGRDQGLFFRIISRDYQYAKDGILTSLQIAWHRLGSTSIWTHPDYLRALDYLKSLEKVSLKSLDVR